MKESTKSDVLVMTCLLSVFFCDFSPDEWQNDTIEIIFAKHRMIWQAEWHKITARWLWKPQPCIQQTDPCPKPSSVVSDVKSPTIFFLKWVSCRSPIEMTRFSREVHEQEFYYLVQYGYFIPRWEWPQTHKQKLVICQWGNSRPLKRHLRRSGAAMFW